MCVCRALVGMMMYNSDTKEIAKPSELLNSIKAIMNVLQSIENYGIVLLQCYHHHHHHHHQQQQQHLTDSSVI